jgi:uncharacterized YigZ family protein
MKDKYLSIQEMSEGLYKDKGSKFIALAYPVNHEDEVKQLIQSVKKEHYSARHHCFAYVIGNNNLHFRAYDDGEPRHTAGDPILNQIRSFQLTDVLVIVVRYFGGTKLGKSGLINAYKTASKEALSKATIIEKVPKTNINIDFSYEGINDVMHVLQQYDFKISDQKYEENCRITGLIPMAEVQELINRLSGYKSVINIGRLPG